MSSDSSSLADRVRNKLKLRSKSGFEKFMDYSKKNVYVAGGFTAGVFNSILLSDPKTRNQSCLPIKITLTNAISLI